jgi:tetratricopeptide (TPR) repeat protein
LAREAIETGKDDPDALWMGGFTIAYVAGEHGTAASVIDRALTLNPNSAQAWSASGYVSSWRNQPGPAIEAFQRAMRLSPLDPLGYMFSGGLAFAHFVARRYDEAVEWADRCLLERPRFSSAIRVRVASCAHLGHIEEARDWLKQLLDLQPGLTIAGCEEIWAAMLFPQEIVALYLEGFRRAGLPEE